MLIFEIWGLYVHCLHISCRKELQTFKEVHHTFTYFHYSQLFIWAIKTVSRTYLVMAHGLLLLQHGLVFSLFPLQQPPLFLQILLKLFLLLGLQVHHLVHLRLVHVHKLLIDW